jgi:hypothetical protein
MVYIRKDGTANRTNETLCFAFERMPTLVTSPYNHGQYSRDHWRNCLKYGEEFIETTGPSKMVNKPLMWEWKDSALYIGYDNAVVIWMLQRLLGNHRKKNKSQHKKVLLSRINICNLEKRNGIRDSIRYCKNDAEDRSILPKFIYVMNSNQKIKKPTLHSGME